MVPVMVPVTALVKKLLPSAIRRSVVVKLVNVSFPLAGADGVAPAAVAKASGAAMKLSSRARPRMVPPLSRRRARVYKRKNFASSLSRLDVEVGGPSAVISASRGRSCQEDDVERALALDDRERERSHPTLSDLDGPGRGGRSKPLRMPGSKNVVGPAFGITSK
jgi:hypothetical protein